MTVDTARAQAPVETDCLAARPAETYIEQNARSSTNERRMLRAVLRSLEGQTVRWPYTTVAPARKGLLAATSDRRAAPVISTARYTALSS